MADHLRGPGIAPPGSARGRAHHLLLEALRRGGIPAGVATFGLGDHPELRFVSHDSLVLHQLYWFGEQGWEPQLLPWWRRCCARASAILELGANVGYFTVQGARAAPRARYVAVEPHPVSAEVCRANLALNGIGSVELVQAAAVPRAGRPGMPGSGYPPAPGSECPEVPGSECPPVELRVPAGQLATPTVAFLGDGTELPPPMRRHVTETVAVPAVDVRSLLAGVDLVKLDVEGQEHALLAAARDHLRARRPTVFVEVLPGTAQLRQLLAELCRDDGYRCHVPVADGGLVELEAADLLGARLLERYGGQDVILSADPGLDRP
jgi:FkbM family methyltransferase